MTDPPAGNDPGVKSAGNRSGIPASNLIQRAEAYIKKHGLTAPGDHVLAAVSGGPDSVALLDILTRLKEKLGLDRITVVHFDHRLRGEESDADREFVRSLALGAGLDFECGSEDVRAFAKLKKVSLEMAGRAGRHEFFRKTAAALGAGRIALAHTASDQAEEVVLRLIRGAGPGGLRGMLPAARNGIIRPLLFATRAGIIGYIEERSLGYRQDSSNLEPVCRRNFLRLRVFPMLEEAFHPEITRTIARSADLARDEGDWWEIQVREAWDRCAGDLPSGWDSMSGVLGSEVSGQPAVVLDLEKIRSLHPALLRRLLRHAVEKLRGNLSGIQAVHLEPLFNMALRDMPGKSALLPGGSGPGGELPVKVEAVQRSGTLFIRALPVRDNDRAPAAIDVTGPGRYEFGDFVLEFAVAEKWAPSDSDPADPRHAVMDAEKLQWPLRVRSRQPGDRFRPSGMAGSKKLQDLFTDLKIPRDERGRIPILCDRGGIIWVAGLRLDGRVTAGQGTEKVVRIRLARRETGSRA